MNVFGNFNYDVIIFLYSISELYSIVKPICDGSRGYIKLVQSNLSKQNCAAKYVRRKNEEFASKEVAILKR